MRREEKKKKKRQEVIKVMPVEGREKKNGKNGEGMESSNREEGKRPFETLRFMI